MRILFLFTMCAARSDFFFLGGGLFLCSFENVSEMLWNFSSGKTVSSKRLFWSVVHKNVLCQKNKVPSSMTFLSCPLREI